MGQALVVRRDEGGTEGRTEGGREGHLMKLWTGQQCWRPKSHPVTSSSLVNVLRRTVLTLNLYKQGWYEGRRALLSVSHLLLPLPLQGGTVHGSGFKRSNGNSGEVKRLVQRQTHSSETWGCNWSTGHRTAEPVLTVLGGQSLPAGHFYLVGVGHGRKRRARVGPSGLRAQGMGEAGAGGVGVGRGPTLL